MNIEPTEANREALAEYVTELQKSFGLMSWNIEITDEPADPDDLVSSRVARNYEYARWRFAPEFWNESPEEQRSTLIHELVHLFTQHAQDDLMSAFERAISKNEFRLSEPVHRRAHERVIDRIAEAIAPKYPVIEWPESPVTESP